MKSLQFRYSPLSDESIAIADVTNLASGIGFGEPQSELRATAEALERFWQKRGPSDHAKIYSLSNAFNDDKLMVSEQAQNVTDSSGTAIHRSLEKAIESACLEFIERQSLIAHWRFSTHGVELSMNNPAENDHPSETWRIYEISIFEGVYVCLALFSSPAKSTQYSAGAASGFHLQSTAEKALRECRQAILSMQDNLFRRLTGRPLMDCIQDEYLKANKPNTSEEWSNSTALRVTIPSQLRRTPNNALELLANTTNPPLMLVDSLSYDGSPWYIARLLSNDWPSGLQDDRPDALKTLSTYLGNEFRPGPVPFG